MTTRILHGDCREVLRTLPDASVHCCVTSPPYYGLRDYGTAQWEGGDNSCDHTKRVIPRLADDPGIRCSTLGRTRATTAQTEASAAYRDICGKCGARRIDSQIGLEPSPDEYVAQLVAVFREVWRVLRPDGVCFLNLGDSYVSGPTGGIGSCVGIDGGVDVLHEAAKRPSKLSAGKPKDLLGIPWMVAFALRADGWWLRQDNIWAKRSCMPESTDSRTTRAHEYIFQLTKSGDTLYWTHRDLPGVRKKPAPDYRWRHRVSGEEMSVMPDDWDTHEHVKKVWRRVNLWEGHDYFYDAVAIEEEGVYPSGHSVKLGDKSLSRGQAKGAGITASGNGNADSVSLNGSRNKRSVWWMATHPFPEAHFATFPPELPEVCIKAGTSERGCCPHCEAPWERVVERVDTGRTQKMADGWDTGSGGHGTIHRQGREKGETGIPILANRTIGWRPTCSCPAHEPVPCTVLDPFFGAGTTGLVADRLGRNCIGIELNQGYTDLTRRRIEDDAGMFASIA